MTGTAIFQYDAGTGSVIVFTDEETNEHIKKIVESLDRPVPQVLIKVLFLEVTHSNSLDLGVEMQLKSVHGTDSQEFQTLFGLPTDTGGFYKIIDDDLAATIRAIAKNNKLEVLSRPSVLARNNQAATIMVGESIPFITNTQYPTGSGNPVTDYEYRDIGIILNVTPHIAPERMVEMQVTPEISTRTGETVPIQAGLNPEVISKRAADTRVLVGDGKTVVIGGMMGNTNTEEVNKVPLLGDIPYLGALFRHTTKNKEKTELLIFLTPLVVEGPEELNAVTKAEKQSGELAPTAFSEGQIQQFMTPSQGPQNGGSSAPGAAGKERARMLPGRASGAKVKGAMERKAITKEELEQILAGPKDDKKANR
jgi:general secretion pathway protein D